MGCLFWLTNQPAMVSSPAHNCAVQELSLVITTLPNACRWWRGKLLPRHGGGGVAEQQVLEGVGVAKARRQAVCVKGETGHENTGVVRQHSTFQHLPDQLLLASLNSTP